MWFCRWIYLKKQTWRSSPNHPKNQPYRASLYQRSRESAPVSGIALAYWKWLHSWQAEEHGSYVSEGMFFGVVKNSLRHLGMCQNRHCLWGTSMRTSYFGYRTVTRGWNPCVSGLISKSLHLLEDAWMIWKSWDGTGLSVPSTWQPWTYQEPTNEDHLCNQHLSLAIWTPWRIWVIEDVHSKWKVKHL